MNSKNRILVIIGAVAVLVLAGLLFSKIGKEKHSSEAVKVTVGVLFPLTGDAASYGEKGREAIDLAVAGLVPGGHCGNHPVQVVYEDSRADPTTGVTAFQKLVTANGVVAVVGDIVSSVTLAIAPIAESKRVLIMSPTASAPAITDSGQYIYRIWPSDLVEGKAIAQFAKKRGFRRAAILHLDNDYGVAIAGIFKKTFEAAGSQVISQDGYQQDGKDFRTLLTRIGRDQPDVLYIAGYFADTATIIRQARELGVTVQVLGTTAIEDSQFLKLAGQAAEGLDYPLATGFDAASEKPAVRAFVNNFVNRYKHEPGWVEAQAFDAFNLICSAMASIQGVVTGTTLKATIDHMDVYEGVAGPVRFNENGDVMKPLVIRTIRDGRFVPLSPTEL